MTTVPSMKDEVLDYWDLHIYVDPLQMQVVERGNFQSPRQKPEMCWIQQDNFMNYIEQLCEGNLQRILCTEKTHHKLRHKYTLTFHLTFKAREKTENKAQYQIDVEKMIINIEEKIVPKFKVELQQLSTF